MTLKQWQPLWEGMGYAAVGETVNELPPGVYDVAATPNGLVWQRIVMRDDLLLKFPDSPSARIVDEIELFWTREDDFRRHDLPFKRGILLHGPPGSGKSSTLRLIAKGVVDGGGYVLQFTRPVTLVAAVRELREIHADANVVVLMEDLDSILVRGDESAVLNLLDGAENVDKMVFLATTNYPEQLKARISNRPSRFDRRVLIPHPGAEARRMYLQTLLREGDAVDVGRYVRDSEGMSLAHLKELFVATAILGADYEATLRELRDMAKRANSVEDEGWSHPGVYA